MTNDDIARSTTTTHGQTGPRTEARKATSSRNSLRTGLYAARDFVRPEEDEEYAQTLIKLMDELVPGNSIEETFATEIMGATWRLRRCRLIEEHFGIIPNLDFDPMLDERTEKQQKSVDRARAQSHLILRRSLDELRKLQKVLESPLRGESRTIPEQIADQLPKSKPTSTSDACPVNMDALMAVSETQLADRFHETAFDSFCNAPAAPAPAAASFCKPASTTPVVSKNIPRNAPCPCKSGAKYKKCCGGPAAAAQKQAA